MSKRMLRDIVGVVGILIFLILSGSISPRTPAPAIPQEQGQAAATSTGMSSASTTAPVGGQTYAVLRVIDGDTIAVSVNGASETIRLIGIDTPETVDPRKPVQCFGKEASDKAKELLAGQHVMIEKDSSQGERDKYGRLLAYIYRSDGLFINKYLVEQGYAHEYTYNAPYKYQAEFKAAQAEARAQGRGLWALGVCNGSVSSATIPTPAPTPAPVASGGYSCSSNLYNCADFATHAQAQSVYEMCGGVNNDIHRLDSDKDGVACETLP